MKFDSEKWSLKGTRSSDLTYANGLHGGSGDGAFHRHNTPVMKRDLPVSGML